MSYIIEDIKEYENFILNHPKGHFMQSSKWASLKEDWVFKAVASRDANGEICGTMAVLIRKLPKLPYTLMYACRGPVCNIYSKDIIADLLDGIKKLAVEHKTYELKIDPDVSIKDENFSDILEGFGFKCVSDGKGFESIQPKFVFRLDIENKNEDEVFKMFHSKTRYNIRYSSRNGVVVKICSKDMLETFSKIMIETGLRDGFVTRPCSYFEKMLDCMGDNARLYMAYSSDGTPIAGSIAIHFGDKLWYLYGASSNEYRNLMPNYLLQWEMIRWAIEKGCRIYDFRGVSGDLSEDNPLYGLYRFKKGFGGELCEFVGEYSYIFKPHISLLVKQSSKVFKKARRQLFLYKNRSLDTSKPKNITGKQ